VTPGYAGCKSESDGLLVYGNISKYWHYKSKKKGGRTSQVEAFNTILRQRLSRLVRRTCAFSKSEEMHETVIKWFIQDYNEQILSVIY
jgi:IS1 family transposase